MHTNRPINNLKAFKRQSRLNKGYFAQQQCIAVFSMPQYIAGSIAAKNPSSTPEIDHEVIGVDLVPPLSQYRP